MVLSRTVQKVVKKWSKRGHFWIKKGGFGHLKDRSVSVLKKVNKMWGLVLKWMMVYGPKTGQKVGQKVVN
jgi:hypothetical protein